MFEKNLAAQGCLGKKFRFEKMFFPRHFQLLTVFNHQGDSFFKIKFEFEFFKSEFFFSKSDLNFFPLE